MDANLSGADLAGAELLKADLRGADLYGARLEKSGLGGADLRGAYLASAQMPEAWLVEADLTKANLVWTNLRGAQLYRANLTEANLSNTSFHEADLRETNLTRAIMTETHLQHARLIRTNLSGAQMEHCNIYGISAWDLLTDEETRQSDFIITPDKAITVNNLEVGQFIYLLINNTKIRGVIDTITSKAVLILGRFTLDRKIVLNALRKELEKRGLLPILFDFPKPDSKDLTETVSTLAHLARFIIADLTDPSCIPYELATVVPISIVPVQPILLSGQPEFAMFVDLQRRYHWVLPTHHYTSSDRLITEIEERVIGPAEAKVRELRGQPLG